MWQFESKSAVFFFFNFFFIILFIKGWALTLFLLKLDRIFDYLW